MLKIIYKSLKYFCLGVIFFCLLNISYAIQPLVINNSSEKYDSDINNYEVLYDSNSTLGIDKISSPAFAQLFHKDIYIKNPGQIKGACWVRVLIKNESSSDKNWVLNIYHFQIDSVQLFQADGNGKFIKKESGEKINFSNREYFQRSHVFDINLPADSQYYYFRIKTSNPIFISFGIYSTRSLLKMSLREYGILAIFFGLILALVLYNLLFFRTLKGNEYLYYVLYCICIAVFATTEHGIGFQYLWPDHPSWNKYMSSIALCSSTVTLLLYTTAFLQIQSRGLLHYTFLGIIGCRVLFLIFSVIYYTKALNSYIPDLIAFTFILLASFYLWRKGNRAALYFLIAQILFVTLFSIDLYDLAKNHFLDNLLNLFGLNLGVLFQMMMFSFAFAERIKEINNQKRLMEIRNKELDTFIYKVSHDLKGPLKSIMGLTNLAKEDPRTNEFKTFFEMILKNTQRLDGILADLVLITKVKQASVKKEKIDFENLVQEILSSLQYYPAFHEVDFNVNIHGTSDFYSDRSLLYSVFQNIIENAIKYKKSSTSPLFENSNERSFLKIEVLKEPTNTTIIFSDNGLGIRKEYQEKIFDLFFRIESDIKGTGLGLYLVKMSVLKLGGKIGVASKENIGTTFTIEF